MRAAAQPSSKLLVVEFSLPETAEPSPARFMDLNMLVMLDGRERTRTEYAALFERAGWRFALHAHPQPDGHQRGAAAAALALERQPDFVLALGDDRPGS